MPGQPQRIFKQPHTTDGMLETYSTHTPQRNIMVAIVKVHLTIQLNHWHHHTDGNKHGVGHISYLQVLEPDTIKVVATGTV